MSMIIKFGSSLMAKFIFDLDGTITKEETLPLLANEFGICKEIEELTANTVNGNIPFVESFIKRIYILGSLPIDEVASVLANVDLNEQVIDFIQNNKENCIIATGNLNCWINKLVDKIGCEYFCSDCSIQNNRVDKLTKILRKETIVQQFKKNGDKVVFIGDGNNDAEAMREADVSIASGVTHYPSKSVLSVADYLVFSEEALCRQLNQLL